MTKYPSLNRSHINDIRRDGHDTKSDVPGVLAIESLKSIYNEPTGIRRKSLCHFLLRLHLNDQDETQLIEIQKLLNEIATVSFLFFLGASEPLF